MLTVRAYRPADRTAVYDICVRTAAAGADARGRHSTDQLMGDLFAGPYLALEPQLAFVLADAANPDVDQPVGYVLGTADTAAFVRRYAAEWTPYLAERYPPPPAATDAAVLGLGRHPERMLVPELRDHPAHLHIDLLPHAQGRGHGRLLIATFLAAAARAGAPAVHLGMDPANHRARGFYEHLGFRELPTADASVLYLGRPTT